MKERGSALMRWADKCLGVPLCWTLGLFRRRRPGPPENPRRIALLMTAAIGDTILAHPLWQAVRDRWPAAEVTLFTGPSNAEVLPLFTGYDRQVVLPVKRPLASLRRLRQEKPFDLWIDVGQWPRINALYTFLAPARFTLGFRTAGQYRHYLYDLPVDHSNRVHEVENFAHLGRAAGAAPTISIPQIPRTRAARADHAVVHLHSGGYRGELKSWPEDDWLPVLAALLARGMTVHFTGSGGKRAEIDRLIARAGGDPRLRNEAGRMTLRETADLLQEAAFVLTVNTGIMHLAAALGCRVLALDGPAGRLRWGPLGETCQTIESDIACSPCLYLGFDYGCPVNHCMQSIRPETVLAWINTRF